MTLRSVILLAVLGTGCSDPAIAADSGADCGAECAPASCGVDAHCDDADPCSGVETCDVPSGTCRAGTPMAPASACTTAVLPAGECRPVGDSATCRDVRCGNSVPETGEDCDDGANGDQADGCRDDCTFTCTAAADCDDEDVCNGEETCHLASHTCTQGEPLGCRVVDGRLMFPVNMSRMESGRSVCAAAGMRCVGVPVLDPPEAACLAFHPGAMVTMSINGWRQGVYCNDDVGLACMGRVGCHHCPACNIADMDDWCTLAGTDMIEEIFVECAP